jgi:hypothetical protein
MSLQSQEKEARGYIRVHLGRYLSKWRDYTPTFSQAREITVRMTPAQLAETFC